MFPMNSECLIGISDAFSAFVYGYPSSCPHAQCTPNKSVTTLRYTCRHGPAYTGHACRHLPSAVPRISEDRLLHHCIFHQVEQCPSRMLGLEAVFYKHQASKEMAPHSWQQADLQCSQKEMCPSPCPLLFSECS